MATYQQLPINFKSFANKILEFADAQENLFQQGIEINNYEHRAISTGKTLLLLHIIQVSYNPDEILITDLLDLVTTAFKKDATITIDHHYMGDGHYSFCIIEHQ